MEWYLVAIASLSLASIVVLFGIWVIRLIMVVSGYSQLTLRSLHLLTFTEIVTLALFLSCCLLMPAIYQPGVWTVVLAIFTIIHTAESQLRGRDERIQQTSND
jgi:hypothetical protein